MAEAAIPYRGAREVKLVMVPPRYLLRLRLRLKAMRARLLWQVPIGLVLPTLMLPIMFMTDEWSYELGRGELFALVAVANVGLFVGLGLAVTFAYSFFPSPHEHLRPRAITFRVDGLLIQPRDADAYEGSWHFVMEARKAGAGLDLTIGGAPTLILHVTQAMVGDAPFEQLQIWLQRHGKLRDSAKELE